MPDTELLEMQITDTGARCVAALQEVAAQRQTTAGPPQIYEVGFYKDQLQSNLRKVRVVVSPIKRKGKPQP